jgi:hypothetical protein
MQSIFRPASRREALGEHSGGDRRDGGLKMGWAKPSGVAISMGIDCRLNLGGDLKRPEVMSVSGALDGSGCLQ